jgi:hypothetical protein
VNGQDAVFYAESAYFFEHFRNATLQSAICRRLFVAVPHSPTQPIRD